MCKRILRNFINIKIAYCNLQQERAIPLKDIAALKIEEFSFGFEEYVRHII